MFSFVKRKKFLFIPFLVVIILCLAFGVYAGYFSVGKRALLGVKVGEISVAGKDYNQIVDMLKKQETEIKVVFTNFGHKEFSLTDLGYRVDAEATAQKALEYGNSTSNYFLAFFKTHTVEPIYKIDNDALTKVSAELSQGYKDYVAAVEPTVKYDDKQKKFIAVAGKDGRGANAESILAAAEKAMVSGKKIETEIVYGDFKPLTPMNRVNAVVDSANALLAHSYEIKTNLNDSAKNSFVPSKDELATWIKIPDLESDTQEKLAFQQDNLNKWLDRVKTKVETKTVNGYRYVNPAGKVLKVINDAEDGVTVKNFDQVAKDFWAALEKQENYIGSLETEIVKAKWDTRTVDPGAENLPYPAAPGEKWIDVNLSRHTIAAYSGAKLVRAPSPVGTGRAYAGYATVTGTYKIERKVPLKDMRGFNNDGTKYLVQNVPYSMFFHGGYAIHGGPWVNKKIAETGVGYQVSHGCVNLPTESSQGNVAKWYYDWAPIGTVVRTHY